MTDKIRCLIKVKRILYPKHYVRGEWALFLASIEEVMDGEPYHPDEIKVKGRPYDLELNGVYVLHATLDNNDKYGYSYQVNTLSKECDFSDPRHKRLFLESLFTERQVETLYSATNDPYVLLQNGNITELSKIKGIGEQTAKRMIKKFNDDFEKSRAYVALGEYDLTPSQIDTLIRRFHGDVERMIALINDDPYSMIYEIDGIGWKKADQIARARGIALDDLKRVKAGIIFQLNSVTEQGHTWVTPEWLITNTLSMLGLGVSQLDLFRTALYELDQNEKIWWDDNKTKIALLRLRRIEEQIADELLRLSLAEPLLPKTGESISSILRSIEKEQGWEFTEEQKQAVETTLDNNVSIITGSAGTGKSSTVSGVLRVLGDYCFAQCALSGRAAARLTEITQHEGMTIHRLLGFTVGGGFLYTSQNKLPYDIIILDEISMVGAEIFLDLIRAIPTGSKLIMLGDEGQLESIGLCNLFKDMLESKVIPASRLTKIHRQAAKSAIITESLKVRQQEALIPYDWVGTEVRGELEDLKLVVYGDSILSQSTIIDQYSDLLAEGIDYRDIQIVVPMKQRGEICTFELNKIVQGIVNPPEDPEFDPETLGILIGAKKNDTSNAYYLRKNDRVIVTRNMYQAKRYKPVSEGISPITEDDLNTLDTPDPWEELQDDIPETTSGNIIEESTMPDLCPVFNGDRGIIKSIAENEMVICFDQWGDILIKREDYSKIELGYAMSCHKLQGSEADYVVVGFDMGGRMLLTKEWLYTAITRAKKRCVVCAESRALTYACATSNISIKQTMLEDLLKDRFPSHKGVL